MARLDDYRQAMHAVFPGVSGEELHRVLDENGPEFPGFIIDYGLGPLWHERTGREEFLDCRRTAEALYLAQIHALEELDAVFAAAEIEYIAFKGAANREVLFSNPALRACHDLDLLVHPGDRLRAAAALMHIGYTLHPDNHSISRELVLRRGGVDIDLHWGLLRTGRLRVEPVAGMLQRKRRVGTTWMPHADDALYLLLVHPAFAKHLAGWNMGLHRVADIVCWLGTQESNWPYVSDLLSRTGVRTAAWATLRWAELLTPSHEVVGLHEALNGFCPGRLRRAWLEKWLHDDMPGRYRDKRWIRLLGFSAFLHDSVGDVPRAAIGRYRDLRRREADLAAFEELLGE